MSKITTIKRYVDIYFQIIRDEVFICQIYIAIFLAFQSKVKIQKNYNIIFFKKIILKLTLKTTETVNI